jgi:hypothetical protein
MSADWEPGGPLLEAWSELHAVMVQSLPTDDHFVMQHVIAAYTLLETARVRELRGPGYFRNAIANFRVQAAGVANPVTAGELREAVDKTERAAAGDPFTPQSAVEYAVADRLASEWVAHE